MLRTFLFVGATVMFAVSGASAATCDGFGFDNQLPRLVNSRLAPRTTLLCNRNYASLVSGLAHEPLWWCDWKGRRLCRIDCLWVRSPTRLPTLSRDHAAA